jgi:hypothetical protein
MINCCASAYWCKNFHVKVQYINYVNHHHFDQNISGFRVFMPAINYTAPTQTFSPRPHTTPIKLYSISSLADKDAACLLALLALCGGTAFSHASV